MHSPRRVLTLSFLAASVAGMLLEPPPAAATFPGANGKIAFISDRTGGVEIFVMNADGSGQTRLTFNGVQDDEPTWSPDGTKIAFIQQVPGGVREIFVMNPDGSGQTNLTKNGGFNSAPDWSPDGAKIAYHSGASFCAVNCEIFVMNADGSGQTNLTNGPVNNAHPGWSPDGTKIVFASDRDRPSGQIYTMSSNGTGVTRLTTNTASDGSAYWQPAPACDPQQNGENNGEHQCGQGEHNDGQHDH